MATNGMTANGTRKLQPLKLPPLNLSSLNKMLLRPKSPRPKSSKSSRPRTPRSRTPRPRTPSPRSPPVNANPRLYTENLSLDPPTYIPNVVVQEIPLSELERRVRICEEILYIMNHAVEHSNPVTNYLNNLVYIPYIPEFNPPGAPWAPDARIENLSIHKNGTSARSVNTTTYNINIKPNETNFLNKLPMQVNFPYYANQTLNVEIIRRETISKALFETRLQIHEYEKVPRNVLGARINYSQMPYTVSP